jgi:hypothetical protein
MVRSGDSIESQRAAVDVKGARAKLKARILQIIEQEGPQTDAELEARPEFADYAYSTVRKRRSELTNDDGLLQRQGRRDGCACWALVSKGGPPSPAPVRETKDYWRGMYDVMRGERDALRAQVDELRLIIRRYEEIAASVAETGGSREA